MSNKFENLFDWDDIEDDLDDAMDDLDDSLDDLTSDAKNELARARQQVADARRQVAAEQGRIRQHLHNIRNAQRMNAAKKSSSYSANIFGDNIISNGNISCTVTTSNGVSRYEVDSGDGQKVFMIKDGKIIEAPSPVFIKEAGGFMDKVDDYVSSVKTEATSTMGSRSNGRIAPSKPEPLLVRIARVFEHLFPKKEKPNAVKKESSIKESEKNTDGVCPGEVQPEKR